MARSKSLLKGIALAGVASLALTACASDDDAGGGDGGDGGGTLKLGYVLPETGQLAFLGDPQIAATEFAIERINEAGGVLGNDVPPVVGRDEAGQEAIASQSADQVLGEDVSAVIGAAASGMSLAIIDKITGSGVAQCSGSNTAPTFTDYDDGGFYFRTAPSDVLQGPVLAETIVGDGHSSVALVARADDYGKGLMDATAAALEENGATVELTETYDPKATNFGPVVQKIEQANADAAVVIAFEEGTQILQGMIEAGVGPDNKGVYGADGMRNTDLASLVSKGDPGRLSGMKGTAPASADSQEFTDALQEFKPDLEELQFAPQVYDCVVAIALAAEQAGSADPADFAPEINGVTKDGEKCTDFDECKQLIADGTDIDYDGKSGPLDFIEAGEPGQASIEVYGYNDEGELETLDTQVSTLE
ncbi:ABC transporter substrate-binding protein [Haloechinothrix halophila]|uniref:ABC transporter substrate-binding protein n=1 Tax=Haloechinothrix halophila TaxID=1069073 RepID=UPI000425C6D6|nr:ABC transporter substrate-binding protein [Haloechinothrix halophila]